MQANQSNIKPDRIHDEFPRVGYGLLKLLKGQAEAFGEDSGDILRTARRMRLKLNIGVEIWPSGKQPAPVVLAGCTRDVSIGGLCLIPDEEGFDSPAAVSFMQNWIKSAKVRVNFPIEGLKVSIPGTIAWLNTVVYEGRESAALGIQYDRMSSKLKGLLMMVFNSFNENQTGGERL